jgi:putative ABC transport system permease protein
MPLLRAGTDAFSQGLASVRTHPMRAALAGLAIAAAVATMATVVVVLDGVSRFARASAARAFGSNTFVIAKVAAPGQVSRRELEARLRRNPDIRRPDLRFLERHAGGRARYGATANRRVEVSAGPRRFDGASLVAATASLASIRDLAIDRGRFFSREEAEQAAQVAVVGATIADELFPAVDPVGQTLRIGGRGFRVIGLQQRQGTLAGASLDRNVWIPLRTGERVFGPPATLQILARSPAPDDDLDAVVEAEGHARVSMRARRQLGPGEPDNFDILAPEASRTFVLRLAARVGLAAGPISLMALLAAVVVVTNTILVSVTQRTREIGVRRAIGATRAQVMAEVLAESVLIAVLGGGAGIALVFALVSVANAFGLALELDAETVARSLAAAGLSGLAAGWYPARRATQVDVVEALRIE